MGLRMVFDTQVTIKACGSLFFFFFLFIQPYSNI